MRALRLIAFALTVVALEAVPSTSRAGPNGGVIVVPLYRPYYYPRYYLPYSAIYVGPIQSVAPSPVVYPFGTMQVPAPGTLLAGPGAPAPLQGGPMANPVQGAPMPGAAPVLAAAPMPAAAAAEVDQVLQLLSSPKDRDRMEAAITLGRNKVAKAIEPLQQLLSSDPSARVREAAARALGLIGSLSSLKALQTAAQSDDDRDVRTSAQFAAEAIRTAIR
jgi:hypothetical protein